MNTYPGEQLTVTRSVTPTEAPWLGRIVEAGEIVTAAVDIYGCCTASGIAVDVEGIDGYVELPADAVTATV